MQRRMGSKSENFDQAFDESVGLLGPEASLDRSK